MTPDQWVLLAIVVGALVLFASERIRPDVVGLIVLLALVLSGSVDPGEAFGGFSNPAVITVAAMFVLSAGTVEAGVPEAVAQLITRFGGSSLTVVTISLIVVVGVMSAFMNNIAATVILIPAAITIARKNQATPSRLLMPLSFGSLMGGLVTLVGTPPNLLASEALAAAGERPFSMFDFAAHRSDGVRGRGPVHDYDRPAADAGAEDAGRAERTGTDAAVPGRGAGVDRVHGGWQDAAPTGLAGPV